VIWDAQTGEEIYSLVGHTSTVPNAAFSPDSKLLASVSVDGTLRIWDAATSLPLQTISVYQPLSGIAFTPDGKYVVTSGRDGEVHVYVVHLEDLITLARARLTRGFTQAECQKYLHVETCPEEGE
jgi:WD40 repeat protein